MKRQSFLFLLTMSAALACIGLQWSSAETCLSPFIRELNQPEKYLFVWAVDADAKDNDFLAVIDVDLGSANYGKILNRIDIGSKGNEPHHFGFTDDRTRIWAGSLLSSKIWIFDVETDPTRPKIVKVIEDFKKQTGLASPHTLYAIPGRMLIACLSNAEGGIPTGVAEFTNDGKYIRTLKNPDKTPYGYDLAVKPDLNRMVTSSFTPYRNYRKPLSQMDLNDFGDTLLIWDFKAMKVLQTGKVDKSPLEVRWARKPGSNYGYTNCLLGDSLWMWKGKPGGQYEFKKVASTGKFPADLRQSPDDRYLYVSCFGTSEIQQWDIRNPDQPKLTSTVVPGLHPNMMHVTYDGKRMYVTNSLLSTADYGADRFWVRLVHIGPDGMKVDPFFNVDFTNFPGGPARPHDMLLK